MARGSGPRSVDRLDRSRLELGTLSFAHAGSGGKSPHDCGHPVLSRARRAPGPPRGAELGADDRPRRAGRAGVRGRPRGPLDAILLGMFVLVMSWECFVVWQLCLGFASWLAGPRTLTDLERRAAEIEPVATGLSRTAVLIPVYDDDADAVFAGVRVMARSIRATGAVDDIDIHVLSDTRDPDIAAAEERAYAAFSSWASAGETPY